MNRISRKRTTRAVMAFGLMATAAVVLLPADAFGQSNADDKKVWGGGNPATSAYSGVYVPRVIEVMTNERMSGYSWAGESAGTVENALHVTENPAHLALGQWDILQSLKGQPIPGTNGKVYDFTVLAQDIGPECLYVVTNQAGYDTFGHILGNAWDMSIATGKEGSGSLATLNLLRGMYPELADAEVVQVGGAADIVKSVKAGTQSFGFFVQRPDPNSEVFKAINDQGLHLVPVVDFDLEGTYSFLDLKVAYGGFFGLGGNDEYFTTACTSVALITGTEANVPAGNNRLLRRVQETIARLGSLEPDAFKPNLSSWRDMWDSIKLAAGSKAQEMMEQSKEAFENITN